MEHAKTTQNIFTTAAQQTPGNNSKYLTLVPCGFAHKYNSVFVSDRNENYYIYTIAQNLLRTIDNTFGRHV